MFSTSVRSPSGPTHTTLGITVSPLTVVTVHVITNSLPTIALSSGGELIWTVAQAWGTAGWIQTDTHKYYSWIMHHKILYMQPLVSYLRCTVMFTVSFCTPYGLVTLQVYWVSWWSFDTGSSTKVSDWLLELLTVTPSLVHSIMVTSKSVEHTLIETVSPTVSGMLVELTWIPGEEAQSVESRNPSNSVHFISTGYLPLIVRSLLELPNLLVTLQV